MAYTAQPPKALLRKFASRNRAEAAAAQEEVALAMEAVLRKGIMSGDILDNIFEPVEIDANSTSEFPLHFLAPGTEKDFVAYTIPDVGALPSRHVEGDYVMVPTYDVGAAIDTHMKYLTGARWDVMGAMQSNVRSQITKKLNDDGWHTLIAAGVDRNIVVVDSDAQVGQFTKRAVSLGKTVMRRNGGGNSTSINRGELTDLYVSPEALEDILNWSIDQIDETTRREIFVNAGGLSSIYNVGLHVLDELGEGQEYNLYYTDTLGASMPAVTGTNAHTKVEIAVGLDLRNRDSFVMPVKGGVEVYFDDNLHRRREVGLYAWLLGVGFGSLDNRRAMLFAI